MKQSFLEFCEEVKGYSFHSKTTGYQVYKFELYWSRISPVQCFNLYDCRTIKHIPSYE